MRFTAPTAARGAAWRQGLVALAGVAASLGAERAALACSYGVPYQPGTVQCERAPYDGPHTSVADARFGVTNIDVERPTPSSVPEGSTCAPLQVLGLQFQWGDEGAWPRDVGLLVTLEDGDFPWNEPRLTETPHGLGLVLRADEAGQVQFFGFDSPYDALDLSLSVRAVDCAGALSDPITLRISDPGSPLPEGDGASDDTDSVDDAGCSLSAMPPPLPATLANATSVLLIGLCVSLMAARRAR